MAIHIMLICLLLMPQITIASTQSLFLDGIDQDEVSQDGENLARYIDAVNGTLEDFGFNELPRSCIGNVESQSDRVSENTIIYINEWLRYPSLCKKSINRYKNESKKKCYRRSAKNFKKLIPFIEAAAESFKLNPNYLACLLLQESQFLDTAASGTGPLGLAQISKGTLKTEKVIFKARLPDVCNKTLSRSCNNISSHSRKNQCQKDVRYCLKKQTLVAKRNILAPSWVEYANYANERIRPYYQMSEDKYCGKKECRKNEYWAVGAAALYLKEIKAFYLKPVSMKAASEKELFLMASALYNPGPGALKQVLPTKLKLFQGGWEESIDKKKYSEPREYVQRIRQCLEYSIGQPILKH